jgi:mTERF domain-containing protein, mitochondrial
MAMSSHLSRRAISYCFFSSPQCHRLALLAPLLRSPLSTGAQPQKNSPFIAQYLISSFGFSPDRALKFSADNNLVPIKSPARPETVVKFLSDTGLSETEIRDVISFCPIILSCNVEKTLKPKICELMDAGCSGELLVQLIRHNPPALYLKKTLSRLLFWRDFIGKDEQHLLKIIQRNSLLFVFDIDKHVLPRINLLKEYGLSNPDIVGMLHCGSRWVIKNLDSLRQTLALIEEMGIPRGSKEFLPGLKAIAGFSVDTIKKKVEIFKKTYGWSQEDVCSAFKKSPRILARSNENLRSKMEFLIRKVGIEQRSIASYPSIFGYSLERVLIGRYNVLSTLKAKGLEIKCSLFSACHMSEKRFYKNYVVPFQKDVPGLGQYFVAGDDVQGQA